MSDVYLYWRSGSVHNVENVELPQFSIVEYRAITKIESLLTGTAENTFEPYREKNNVVSEQIQHKSG